MLLNLENVLDDIYEIIPKQKEQDVSVRSSSSFKMLEDKNGWFLFYSLFFLQQIDQMDHCLRMELAIYVLPQRFQDMEYFISKCREILEAY